MVFPNHHLHFDRPIPRWDEALPLGNGLTGCLIWGSSAELRFSLDRGDLWDTTPCPYQNSPFFNFETIKMISKGTAPACADDMFDKAYFYATPTKLPAGKLIFHFPSEKNVVSDLNIRNGEAVVDLTNVGQLHVFVHARKNLGFIRVSLPASDFSVTLQNPEFGIEGEENEETTSGGISAGSLKTLHYPRPHHHQEKNLQYYIQKVSKKLTYGIVLGSREENGETLLVYSIFSSSDSENALEDTIRRVKDGLQEGYDKAFLDHAQWWDHFWQESAVTLPDSVIEKGWYVSNYLLGSCSRKGAPPMPLQGVWTADDGKLPPWKGDYHNDLNTQLCYYSYAKANHLEQGESFLDFLWKLVPTAEKFARDFYHAEGQCLPGVMDIEGKPLGGWPMYSYSPTMQLWLCQTFERHFRLTGDMDFLREKAYPYMKKSAEFILSLLTEDEEGFLVLPVSSSPEIHDDTLSAWLTPNSNFDLSLMRYLFTQLSRLALILKNGEEKRWQDVLSHLSPLYVNEKNVLMINREETLTESHRHMSHAMSIHPLRLLDAEKEEDRKIIEATLRDLVRMGSCNWVGYSLAWMAELWCVLGNGEGAAWQLHNFFDLFCLPNGFHINGDYKKRGMSCFNYRPFTLEGNMCAADAVQEMLLRSENGRVEVFPAIPDQFRKGVCAFETLRAEMGLLVSARMVDGKVEKIVLTAEKTGDWELVSPWKQVTADQENVIFPLVKENRFALHLEKNQTCILTSLQ